MSTSEGQHRSDILETKLWGSNRDGLDMCRGETMNILVELCSGWSYQAGGKEEVQSGD